MSYSNKKIPTVLIVDENIKFLDLIERGFKGEEFLVAAKNSFEDALEYLQSDKTIFLIICCHCESRGIDGLSFLNQVSNHSPKILKYLTSCCLSRGELESQRIKGNIQYYSKLPFKFTGVLKNIRESLKQYNKKIYQSTPDHLIHS
ncbi:MAG: response regulator [Nitrospinae bacterium]|nr:response regulator [Nitrospinota bacterium]